MSQENLNNVNNLFVYTKTNIDQMFARYTNTNELNSNYYQKTAVDDKVENLSGEISILNTNLSKDISDLSGSLSGEIDNLSESVDGRFQNLETELKQGYDKTETGMVLSTWIKNEIKNCMTSSFKFMGIKNTLSELPTTPMNGAPYVPEIGHIWLIRTK